MSKKEKWDTKAMAGRAQIFLCRAVHNDVTFLDEYLTEEFCHRHKLFVYRYNQQSRRREIVTREFPAVKEQLLRQLANGGAPVLEVVDRNYANRSELLLQHRHDGQELRKDWAEASLVNIARLWKRPVHLDTIKGEELVRLSTDGSSVRSQPAKKAAAAD
jgi:stage V sporulation protein R